MLITDLIDKKANKEELTNEELKFFVNGYVKGNVPDYQMSAFLMAIRLNSMSEKEMFELTNIMIESGETIDFGDLVTVDKHSTGGVGDKTSIALGPVLRAMGMYVGKMSGRGLGFTGGTVDKLESIKNFSVELSKEAFIKQVRETGIAIIGQSDKIVPADKKIYALRDVTATVASMPLIAASIMAKKLATGAKIILLDVKCGSGAFMQNIKDARELSHLMIMIGNQFGRKTSVEITSMVEPLGNAIGNGIEVKEAIDTLKGKGPKDFEELIISSAATIYTLHEAYNKRTVSTTEARAKAKKVISDGSAYETFESWIKAQGGDLDQIKSGGYFKPTIVAQFNAWADGYVSFESCNEFGNIAILLGAGRRQKSDKLDYHSGLYLNRKVGDTVKKGESIVTIYATKPISKDVMTQLKENIRITKERPPKSELILAHVER